MKRRPRVPGMRVAHWATCSSAYVRESRCTGSTLYVLPAILDDDPVELKNGIAIRNACAVEGKCPACGAVGELYADKTLDGLFHLLYQHEDECPVLRDGEAA